jgi:hypothetical protein
MKKAIKCINHPKILNLNTERKENKIMNKVYIVSIQEHHSWRIAFVSGDIEKVKNFLRTAYKLNDEDVTYLIEWKELYNVFTDSKLILDEIELDKVPDWI